MLQLPEWDPSLSVGNLEIDEQHKKLIDICHQTVAYLANSSPDAEQFHKFLNDFVDFTRIHFKTEERLLARNGCPTLDEHRAEHNTYLEMLTELLFEGTRQHLDNLGLANIMTSWVGTHLVSTDLPAKEYMRE